MIKEQNREFGQKPISRRKVLETIGKGILAGTLVGCGTQPQSKEVTSEKPTSTLQPTREFLETPTLEPTVTPKVELTPSPEAIIFPQTEITAELLKQGFSGIGGEEVDLGKMATPEAAASKLISWQTIEGYTSLAWNEQVNLEDLSQDELKATKALISLGSQAGVEGFYQPGEILPQFKDLTLLRLTINQLPNNQDFYDAKLNASPQNLIIRKGTHLTVLGLWADESGRWATVSIDEGFDREKQGIAPRDVPRQYLAVIPQNLPENTEGLSLSRLLNANNYLYHQGVVEHLGENSKLYHQELNTIEPTFAKRLEKEAGALFMDRKEDGSWYENPVVPYPPSGVAKQTEDGRTIAINPQDGKELWQALLNQETREWQWLPVTTPLEPTPEPTKEPTATPEPAPTKETGVLYEKDFQHLRNEEGEWRFGEIFYEVKGDRQTSYYFTTVILEEPKKRQVNALDNNGNVIHTYECWFVKIGYPDPQSEDKRLVTGEVLVWVEDMLYRNAILIAKDGYISKEAPGHAQDEHIENRDGYLSLFQDGKPVVMTIVSDQPNGRMKQVLTERGIDEPFPGSTPLAKRIYFVGLMADEENGIGKLDLPSPPTFEEIKAWKEDGQLPERGFLGEVIRLVISDK